MKGELFDNCFLRDLYTFIHSIFCHLLVETTQWVRRTLLQASLTATFIKNRYWLFVRSFIFSSRDNFPVVSPCSSITTAKTRCKMSTLRKTSLELSVSPGSVAPQFCTHMYVWWWEVYALWNSVFKLDVGVLTQLFCFMLSCHTKSSKFCVILGNSFRWNLFSLLRQRWINQQGHTSWLPWQRVRAQAVLVTP